MFTENHSQQEQLVLNKDAFFIQTGSREVGSINLIVFTDTPLQISEPHFDDIMSLVISQLIAILPWIFGIFSLYLAMPKYFRAGYGFQLLMIGTAFFIGYLGLAVQIWLLDQLNIKSISPYLLVTNSIIFFILLIIKYFSKESSFETTKVISENSMILFLF